MTDPQDLVLKGIALCNSLHQLPLLIELIRGAWQSCTIKSHRQRLFFKRVWTFNTILIPHFPSVFCNSWRLSLHTNRPSRRVNFHLPQTKHSPEQSSVQDFLGTKSVFGEGNESPSLKHIHNLLKHLFKTCLHQLSCGLSKHTSHGAEPRRNVTHFNQPGSQRVPTAACDRACPGIVYNSPQR